MSVKALDTQPTRQQLAAKGRTAPGKVTGKLKDGIDAMVWLGLDFAAAAKQAGLKPHAIRYALDRPHVKAYYAAQLDVLRSSERARNIHRAKEIRDAANNMPAIHACRYIDGEPNGEHVNRGGMAQVAGFVIVLRESAAQQTPMVDVSPVEPE